MSVKCFLIYIIDYVILNRKEKGMILFIERLPTPCLQGMVKDQSSSFILSNELSSCDRSTASCARQLPNPPSRHRQVNKLIDQKKREKIDSVMLYGFPYIGGDKPRWREYRVVWSTANYALFIIPWILANVDSTRTNFNIIAH